MKSVTATLALLCLAVVGFAVPPASVVAGATGRALVESEWHKEAKGFAATVVITPDPDWKRKCSVPAAGLPCVDRTNAVRIGGKVWAVVLLTNPLPDETGNVNVTCDLRLARPNGTVSEHRGLRALQGKLAGPAARTYLSEIGLTMIGEASDPLGEWVLELVVHDYNRGVEVPLVARYTLLPKETGH